MWKKITRGSGVRCYSVFSGSVLTFSLALLISVSGTSPGYAVGAQAIVTGNVLESVCDVDILDDNNAPVSEYTATIENQTVGGLSNGNIGGLFGITIELTDCMGVALDDKYQKTTMGVSVAGTTTVSNFLFRAPGAGTGTENDAPQGYGFAITTKDPLGGKTMPWSPADLVADNGMLDSRKTVVALQNNGKPGETVPIKFWLGISCGGAAACGALSSPNNGGSLKADIEFTFGYQ